VAALLGKTRDWVIQGLRAGYFLNSDGSIIEPLRTGRSGHRRYTRRMLWAMAWSARRRGELSRRDMRRVVAVLNRTQR
jgi:hypothetical protein